MGDCLGAREDAAFLAGLFLTAFFAIFFAGARFAGFFDFTFFFADMRFTDFLAFLTFFFDAAFFREFFFFIRDEDISDYDDAFDS
jgi:hypothetical protein